MVKIAVVGGGISGLSSAVCIQESLPGVKVTVISEAFSPNTTADVAAGMCIPYLLQDTPVELQMRWYKETQDHIAGLYQSENAHEYGISLISGYWLFSEPQDPPTWRNFLVAFDELNNEELRRFPITELKAGWNFTTYICECVSYLPYLEKRFTSGGGIVKQKKVKDLTELADDFDIIVVCVGVQSKELANDSGVYPVRGQIIQVAAPWIKHFYILNSDAYITPQQNVVVLGGTRTINDYQLTARQEDHDAIYEKCCKIIPTLKKCKIIQDKVGLRPGRSVIRIEKGNPVQGIKSSAQVVYNYGHGGSGITLHWGCAQDVAQIVSRILVNSKL